MKTEFIKQVDILCIYISCLDNIFVMFPNQTLLFQYMLLLTILNDDCKNSCMKNNRIPSKLSFVIN